MRRFYIVTRTAFFEHVNIGGHSVPRFNLFHQGVGSMGIDLDHEHILISTDFARDWPEEQWHSHPEVARLPHPIEERSVKISALHSDPQHAHKQFNRHHMDKLKKIGVDDTHTVWDLHRIAIKINPAVKLSNVY